MTPLDAITNQMTMQELLDLPKKIEEVLQIVGAHEQAHNPKFTGEKIFKGDPEKYRRIVQLRTVLGASLREIARIEGVSTQTVTAIMRREQEGKTAQAYREETALDLATAVQATIGRIMEDLNDDEKMKETGLRDKAYLLKELTEKKELLSGGATHRGEQVDKGEADKMAAMKHAEQARELLKGELIEVETDEEQTSEGGDQRSEVRGQTSEVREQRSEVRGQTSEVREYE